MDTPQHYQTRVIIERYAERAALFQIQGESFKQCLRLNHLAIELAMVDKKGTSTPLRGQDLVNSKTWTSFLTETKVSLSWLSYEAGAIAVAYARWLCTSYTDRYQAITTTDEITWLRQVARLAVLWHIMQHKYDTHSFLDPWVESEMGKLLLLRDFCREMARAVNRGIKEPGQATALLEQTYEKGHALLADRAFTPYEAAMVLPPGTADPLALPEEVQGHE